MNQDEREGVKNEIETDNSENPIIKLGIATKELADAFEGLDIYPRTKKVLNDTNNWILAVSAGSLLLILNNYKTFLLNYSGQGKTFLLPEKCYFLVSVIFLILAVIVLGYNKIVLIRRDWKMSIAIDKLNILRDDILNPDNDEPDIEKYVDERIKENYEFWREGHDMIVHRDKNLIIGIILCVIGLTLYVSYVLLFIYKYN